MRLLLPLVCFFSATFSFGQKIGIRTDNFDKVQTGDSLGGVDYYRITQIGLDFDGVKPYTAFNNIVAAGKFVIQNFNWSSQAPTPFCTNITKYTATLTKFLTMYKPDLLAIENEETNYGNYSSPVQNYIQLLTTATTISHSFGVKVTNGGLTIRVLTWLVYKDFIDRGLASKAADFAAKCIPDVEMRALSHPGINPTMDSKIDDGKKLVAAYKIIPLDYINIHYYEPVKYRNTSTPEDIVEAVDAATPGALRAIVNYLRRQTGKQVISNEMGQMNKSGNMVSSMLAAAKKMNLQYIIWQDINGTGGGSNNQSVALEPQGDNGHAFTSFLFAQRGSGKIISSARETRSNTKDSGRSFSPAQTSDENLFDNKNLLTSSVFNVSIYPNPATSIAKIQVKGEKSPYDIMLTDLRGKILWQATSLTDDHIKIPMSNFANGIYLVVIDDPLHKQTLKLVKQ